MEISENEENKKVGKPYLLQKSSVHNMYLRKHFVFKQSIKLDTFCVSYFLRPSP